MQIYYLFKICINYINFSQTAKYTLSIIFNAISRYLEEKLPPTWGVFFFLILHSLFISSYRHGFFINTSNNQINKAPMKPLFPIDNMFVFLYFLKLYNSLYFHHIFIFLFYNVLCKKKTNLFIKYR